MRSTNEPQDRDLTLGSPIRPAAPAKPDVIKPFEAGDHSVGLGNQSKAIETMLDTLRKAQADEEAQPCDYGAPIIFFDLIKTGPTA